MANSPHSPLPYTGGTPEPLDLSRSTTTSYTGMPSHTEDTNRFSQSSQSLSRKGFRHSTHLIPAPALPAGKRFRTFEPWYMHITVVIFVPLVMLCLGAALETATMISGRNQGFPVPQKNVFGTISTQFLLSFFPTVLIIPFAFVWRELDWTLRWYQPYVVLWNGNAKAEESLLLDYVELGPFLGMFRALRYKHRLIFWSSLTAMATYIFQPLTGSVFQLRYNPQSWGSNVTSIRQIGLSPDVLDLNAFAASAGFAEAAAFNNLDDPPFVHGGWATAEFIFPTDAFLNGSMTVNTTGIQTKVNCANPASTTVQPLDGDGFNVSYTSTDGCIPDSTVINASIASQQYGVVDAGCPDAASLNITFRPVMFWYFHIRDDNNQGEAKGVFCKPSIAATQVTASAGLSDGKLLNNVTFSGNYVTENNVTGGELGGKAFNGVLFDNSTDPFIQARSIAIKGGIPGAVFRLASQKGLQATFDLPNGLLDLTSTVYTQHLSLAAKTNFFLSQNSTLPAEMTAFLPRLVIDPFPAHTLAIALFLIGLIGIFLHIFARRQRRKLLLSAPPGSIASIVALTSRSGFGELLLPYDDEHTLEKKLDGLRFRLDRRTGAIVAEDEEPFEYGMEGDDAKLSLLGNQRQRPASIPHTPSSSQLAYQTATGYPPWVGPVKSYNP
ncbi:hypothetical protein BDQ17DRAFT_1353790 [Cyathus striatus]|nr:hypothetical protein BDQ17DRAFT_1353790 [Cyathus striatus]